MKVENIKFKAKSILDGAWVQGDLIHKEDGRIAILRNGFNVSEVAPSTVCQFTGLKDCEGNEIWEGDILEGVSNCEIVFTKGTFATHSIGDNGKVYSYPLCYFVKEDRMVDDEVVGNKFDKKK